MPSNKNNRASLAGSLAKGFAGVLQQQKNANVPSSQKPKAKAKASVNQWHTAMGEEESASGQYGSP